MLNAEQFRLLRIWYARFRLACPDDSGFVREPRDQSEEALHCERFLTWCREHMDPETFAILKRETSRAFVCTSE